MKAGKIIWGYARGKLSVSKSLTTNLFHDMRTEVEARPSFVLK